VLDAELSPDTNFVTYVHGEKVDDQYHHRLWLYDIEGETETKLADWEKDFMDLVLTGPSFSSDGEKVIFSISWLETNNNGLAVVNIDDRELEILTTKLSLIAGPKFSPDNNHIMVTCAGLDVVTRKPGFQLCLLDNNGRYITHLTNSGDAHGNRAFTPDGTKIVFSEFEFGGLFGIIIKPEDRFYIMDIDGENKILLLNWEVAVKGFSDDGKEIIFQGRPDQKSPWGIYIINIDGSNLRHLTYFDDFLEEWYSDIETY
jgi:Tol biopolymer transport system component